MGVSWEGGTRLTARNVLVAGVASSPGHLAAGFHILSGATLARVESCTVAGVVGTTGDSSGLLVEWDAQAQVQSTLVYHISGHGLSTRNRGQLQLGYVGAFNISRDIESGFDAPNEPRLLADPLFLDSPDCPYCLSPTAPASPPPPTASAAASTWATPATPTSPGPPAWSAPSRWFRGPGQPGDRTRSSRWK